jgi:hypothetical protein
MGSDSGGMHKNAIQPVLASRSMSHPRSGSCSAVRGRTWLWFAPCLTSISRVSNQHGDVTDRCCIGIPICESSPANQGAGH